MLFLEGLVGFQGRGFADGLQLDFCHALFLEVLNCSTALTMSHDSRTALEHKTPESNKSVPHFVAEARGERAPWVDIAMRRFPFDHGHCVVGAQAVHSAGKESFVSSTIRKTVGKSGMNTMRHASNAV